MGTKCCGESRCKSGVLLAAADTCGEDSGEGDADSGTDRDRPTYPGLPRPSARSCAGDCLVGVADRESGRFGSLRGKLKSAIGGMACEGVMGRGVAGNCAGEGTSLESVGELAVIDDEID